MGKRLGGRRQGSRGASRGGAGPAAVLLGLLLTLAAPLPAAAAAQAGGDDRLTLTVAAEPDPPVTGSRVTWVLEVVNQGGEPVTLHYADAQRGDVVLRRDGAEAYRWSNGRGFAQEAAEETLAPGEQRAYRLEDRRFNAEAGDYELEATLCSEPAPLPARRAVVVSPQPDSSPNGILGLVRRH